MLSDTLCVCILRALLTRITESRVTTVSRMAMTIILSLNFNYIFLTPLHSGGIAAYS
jgi:hypothetical protein